MKPALDQRHQSTEYACEIAPERTVFAPDEGRAGGQGEAVSRKREFAESRVLKRSVRIGAHNTSFTVEEEFWRGLKEISLVKQLPLANLLADIDRNREHANFSSAVRLFVLDYYVNLANQKTRDDQPT